MMRSIKNIIYFLIFFSFVVLARPVLASVDGALKLSITPPLFKINMDPGETWSSTVKLVNNNTYPITIYADVLDFKSGANGGVEFIKDSGGGKNMNSLSGWVDINREPVIIGPQESAELPFFIKLPKTADPGGHYAAILAGSKPPAEQPSGSAIKISSMLASLLLVRVSGNVVEQGEIREFSVDKNWSWDMKEKLKVVFANTGNTHLQPAGEVKIINMWGETRAIFKIDKKISFGNVLPDSVKQWEFDWQGANSIMDAGRLRAELVIGFGEEATQTDARVIYFWAIAWKPTVIVLGIIILLLLIIVLLIRRYINKSLRQVREQAQALMQKEKSLTAVSGTGRPAAPGASGGVVIDSHGRSEQNEPAPEQLSWSLFKRIVIFLLIIIIASLIAFAFYNFGGFKQGTKEPATLTADQSETETAKEPPTVLSQVASTTATSTTSGVVTITDAAPAEPVATSSTSSPAIIGEPAVATTTEEKIIKVSIQNGGGVRGAAAKAAELIKSSGAEITSLGNAANFDYQLTELRYKPGVKTQAGAINILLGGKATLVEDEKITEDVVVILGKDFK